MTPKQYNDIFYPQYQRAISFVNGIEHVLQKSDDDFRKQLMIIGWNDETKIFILDALLAVGEAAKCQCRWFTPE